MKLNTSTVIFYFCAVLFIFVQGSFAQMNPSGTISGVVTDFNGAVFPNVTIKIEFKSSDNKNYLRVTSSDSQGKFTFENLPAGIYIVSAEFHGLSYKNDNVKIETDETVKLAVKLTYGGECENSEGKTIELNEADKAFIVNEILERDLTRKKILDYGMLAEQKGKIILSTENIKSDWLKPFPQLNLMPKDKIQNKADKKGDFLYLSFDEFEIKGQCVVVTFTNSWAVGKNSGHGYLSGGGSQYLYRKEAGKLIGKYIGGWIS